MVKKGIYKHSKTGNLYRVIGTALHSETLEELVVYECLYENKKSKLWVRPAAMFEEIVAVNGEKLPRFVYVSNVI
jgi:hypothetical protein